MNKALLFALLGSLLALSAVAADGEGKKVEVKGKLRTGIVAIGGETTGIILETDQGTFELDPGKSRELREKAAKLDGKMVAITGILHVREGVEVKARKIIAVNTLEEAGK